MIHFSAKGHARKCIHRDLRRIPGEVDQWLDRRGSAVAQPGLQVMERGVDHRRDGDLVDGLHGLAVERNGKPEVPLHAR